MGVVLNQIISNDWNQHTKREEVRESEEKKKL